MKSEEFKNQEYKYGFTTDIENIKAPKGLTEETIKFISMNARKSIEVFTEKKVDLFLEIKIKKKDRISNKGKLN